MAKNDSDKKVNAYTDYVLQMTYQFPSDLSLKDFKGSPFEKTGYFFYNRDSSADTVKAKTPIPPDTYLQEHPELCSDKIAEIMDYLPLQPRLILAMVESNRSEQLQRFDLWPTCCRPMRKPIFNDKDQFVKLEVTDTPMWARDIAIVQEAYASIQEANKGRFVHRSCHGLWTESYCAPWKKPDVPGAELDEFDSVVLSTVLLPEGSRRVPVPDASCPEFAQRLSMALSGGLLDDFPDQAKSLVEATSFLDNRVKRFDLLEMVIPPLVLPMWENLLNNYSM